MYKYPSVSIIMPAYNAEKYIAATVQSIINQSEEAWELLIIDDGSTDTTFQICQSYADKDERITVYHQSNTGVSVARNKGLEKARGTYIVFVDADDILLDDSLKIRIQLMDDADMALASYDVIDESGRTIETMTSCQSCIWNQRQALANISVGDGEIGYQGYLWNKIFSRAIIMEHNIRFETGIVYNEDRLFVVEYVLYSKKVRISNEKVYKYLQNANGAMGKLDHMQDSACEKFLTEFTAYQKICDKLQAFDIGLYQLCAADAQRRARCLYKEVLPTQKKLRNAYRDCIRTFGKQAIGCGSHALSGKKKFKIFIHMILRR